MKVFTMAACAFLLWTLQGALFHRFWARKLSVILSFGCQTRVEGEDGILKETITNAKALPVPVLHVKFQMDRHLVFTSSGNFKVTDNSYRSDIFSCMPWQEIRRGLKFQCQKRGYYTISQVQLVSYDLFFTGHFVASVPVWTALYVYPKAADAQRLDLPFWNLMGQALARRSLLLDPFEIQSVRPYESYDPYRSVNWKATARTGELKVNVFSPTASWQVMFLLDVDSDRVWKDEALTEEAIRLCGSYCQLLIREGIPVSVCSNGTDCLSGGMGFLEPGAGPDHLISVMELLARIQIEGDGHLPMEQVLEELAVPGSFVPEGKDSLIYILISPRGRSSVAKAYGHLCRQSPGSQWILPVRPGQTSWTEELMPQEISHISIYPWEVAYDYSRTS